MTDTKKKARKSTAIPVIAFAKAVIEGRKNGLSNADIAKSLGMKPASFGVRVSTVSRDLRNATAVYKIGDVELSGEAMSKAHKIPVAKLQDTETLEKLKATVVTQGRTLPGCEGITRSRTNWSDMANSLFGEASAE